MGLGYTLLRGEPSSELLVNSETHACVVVVPSPEETYNVSAIV